MRRAPWRVAALAVAAGIGGATLAGCAAIADTASGVSAWENGAAFATNNSYLRSDLHDIGNGIASRQLQATQTACDGLASDAATASGELPTPDQQATNELNSAYTDLVDAAEDCSSARSFSGRGFSRYERRAAAGARLLAEAIARLDHVKQRGSR